MADDVVVVGAGLGGLSLAVDLARHGHPVTVLEAHSVPGGYAHAFRRRRFRFDVSLHHIGGLGPDGTLGRVLASYGVSDRLRVRARDTLFRLRRPDVDLVLPNDPEVLPSVLAAVFPGTKDGLAALFEQMRDLKRSIVEPWMEGATGPPTPPSVPVDATFEDLYRRHLSDPRLLGLLGQLLWMYLGLPPDRVNAAFSTCVLTSSFLERGYYIDGGGAALTEVLVERLEQLGGRCLTRHPVRKIVVEGGRARGVELERGDFVDASVVVSNADPYQTFFDLVGREHLSEVFVHRLRQMEPSLSSYALYAGLDCPPEALGLEDENVFVAHAHDLNAAHARCLDHQLDRTDWGMTSCSRLDPGCAPPGGGVLSFFELTPPGPWHSLPEPDYRARKRQVEQTLLAKYEAAVPGLREHMSVCELGTPRTNTRYSRNHRGAVYGLAQSTDQAGRRRLRNSTPVAGLFLTGAWTWAGGGYEGAVMSGVQTSRALRQQPRTTRGPTMTPTKPHKEPESFRFSHELRVYLEDTDALGITFHGSYVNYLERGRTEAFVPTLRDNLGVEDWRERYLFNVYRLDVTYLRPSRLTDMLVVETRFEKGSRFRFVAVQQIRHRDEGHVLVKARTEVIIVDAQGQLQPIPEELLGLPLFGGAP